MRLEGHTALVHTAAASALGQMLVRLCLKDAVPLVNVVRKPEQAAMLRELGAVHVCDSSAPGFGEALTEAVEATGAEATAALKRRIAAELTTTFATHFAREISLAQALEPEVVAVYAQRATGTKYLMNPSR